MFWITAFICKKYIFQGNIERPTDKLSHRVDVLGQLNFHKTRMTTFIKTRFKVSDDQTNIDKYRLPANITKYQIYQN